MVAFELSRSITPPQEIYGNKSLNKIVVWGYVVVGVLYVGCPLLCGGKINPILFQQCARNGRLGYVLRNQRFWQGIASSTQGDVAPLKRCTNRGLEIGQEGRQSPRGKSLLFVNSDPGLNQA